MNPILRPASRGLLACLALPLLAHAQTPALPSSPPAPAADEPVVLSPFEVRTEKDEGFVASSALAGGRLNLELKDVPAAYSVITRDFIDAIGITNLNEAAEWAPNSMRSVDGSGGGDTFNITAPVTTRGVGNVYQLRQRNFFVYFAPMDSYSIERYDFGRGPNQVLFGNGTVGGQSVSMTKRPRFDRSFETLELTGGSWNNLRSVLDVNRPLTRNLAARASAVWADRDGWRRGEHEITKAVFASLAFKPTRQTEIRLEGEIGRQQRRIPYATFNDQFAGWDGGTLFTGRADTLPANANAAGVGRRGSNYFVYNPQAGLADAIYNYQNEPITLGGGSSATTPIGGFVQVGTQGLGTSGASLLHTINMPGNRFDVALARSKFRLPDDSWTLAPTSSNSFQHFKDLQLTVSHQISDHAFAEIAGDVNRVYNVRDLLEQSGINNTLIDINRTLPNGQPNPKFLTPYGEGQYRYGLSSTNAESARAAFAYIRDLNRWGHYSFNLMGGLTHRLAIARNDFLLTGTGTQAADRRLLGNDSLAIRVRQYWDEPSAQPRPPTSVGFVDPVTPSGNRTITPIWAKALSSFNNANDNNEYYNYALAAMNAKYFGGRFVLLAAVRQDNSKQVVKYTRLPGEYPLDWDGQTIFMRSAAPSDWGALTYTPKDANGRPTGPATLAIARPRVGNSQYGSPLPQYASDRFQDDFSPPDAIAKRQTPSMGTVLHATRWLSLSANYAKAFAFNSSAAPDPNSQLLPPAQGDGWDATARFTLLGGKLELSTGYYTNKEYGNYIDPTSVTNQINGLYDSNIVGDSATDGRNIRGGANMSSVTRDTRTRIADGYEFIITANPSRAWRITANYALPKVWNKDYAPITRAYVASHAELFKQILADAGGMVGPDGRAVANPAVANPAVNAVDQAKAVNAYNAIYSNITSFLPDQQLSQFQPIGNAYVDYTVQDGRLRGLRFGAGVNYRGRAVIGYRGSDSMVNPANPSASSDDPNVDGHTTVWAPAYANFTLTAAYRFRLKEHRELSFNLRVNNLLNDRAVIYTGSALRPSGGNYTSPARETVPAAFAYKNPINFSLTATLKI